MEFAVAPSSHIVKFRSCLWVETETRPFWSGTTAALSSQASSCLRAGHGTDVDNTVESDLPFVMGSQIVVWKVSPAEELSDLASMGFE